MTAPRGSIVPSAEQETARVQVAAVGCSRGFPALMHQHLSQKIMMFSTTDGGDGSHSDFQPKRKMTEAEMLDKAIPIIEKQIKENPIMLYMKGNPDMPMCGFSSKVVGVLKEMEVNFASVNVLDYPAIREGTGIYAPCFLAL
jgi:Glutaredoxin